MRQYKLFPQLAGVLLCLLLTLNYQQVAMALSSAEHQITVNIPEVLRMEVGDDSIVFNLSSPNHNEKYPADSYPAYYTPTSTQKSIIVKVFSNSNKKWNLKIGGEADNGLKVQAIEWSLNRETWHPLGRLGDSIKRGGFTADWLEIEVYFRLAMYEEEQEGEGEYKVRVFYHLSAV